MFLDFLGLLRDGYIVRESDGILAFWSVVLAGVTDVKHLKSNAFYKVGDLADARYCHLFTAFLLEWIKTVEVLLR